MDENGERLRMRKKEVHPLIRINLNQTQVVAPSVTDDAEEDEESMDWWTKYFASIDTMIEVSCGMITKTR